MLSLSGMVAFLPSPLECSPQWCRWASESRASSALVAHLFSDSTVCRPFPSSSLPALLRASSTPSLRWPHFWRQISLMHVSLSCRGVAESAQTRRRGRDHLPQEWQRASECCLGLPTHTDCDQPMFQVSSEPAAPVPHSWEQKSRLKYLSSNLETLPQGRPSYLGNSKTMAYTN